MNLMILINENLSENSGIQGKWFTGDYTLNKNLVSGARNELLNEAHALGGNLYTSRT